MGRRTEVKPTTPHGAEGADTAQLQATTGVVIPSTEAKPAPTGRGSRNRRAETTLPAGEVAGQGESVAPPAKPGSSPEDKDQKDGKPESKPTLGKPATKRVAGAKKTEPKTTTSTETGGKQTGGKGAKESRTSSTELTPAQKAQQTKLRNKLAAEQKAAAEAEAEKVRLLAEADLAAAKLKLEEAANKEKSAAGSSSSTGTAVFPKLGGTPPPSGTPKLSQPVAAKLAEKPASTIAAPEHQRRILLGLIAVAVMILLIGGGYHLTSQASYVEETATDQPGLTETVISVEALQLATGTAWAKLVNRNAALQPQALATLNKVTTQLAVLAEMTETPTGPEMVETADQIVAEAMESLQTQAANLVKTAEGMNTPIPTPTLVYTSTPSPTSTPRS